MSIKLMTRATTMTRWKPPAAEKKWENIFNMQINWSHIWGLSSPYTTPRDETTWLKLMHRTLWVAKYDSEVADKSCKHKNCNCIESMRHLAECQHICTEFWKPVEEILIKCGLQMENTLEFRILGLCYNKQKMNEELVGAVYMAWRCLYAEITRCKTTPDHPFIDCTYTFQKWLQLLISRLKAYGCRWKSWYRKQIHIRTSKYRETPYNIRQLKLLSIANDGTFSINSILLNSYIPIANST